MKIKFIEKESEWGKLDGIVFTENNGNKTMNAGRYTYDNKMITIVKQRYWYILLFILAHEFIHWVIDCIFPYKEENEFGFNLDEKGLLQYVYLNPPKVHFLHGILDEYWKIPKSWKGDK